MKFLRTSEFCVSFSIVCWPVQCHWAVYDDVFSCSTVFFAQAHFPIWQWVLFRFVSFSDSQNRRSGMHKHASPISISRVISTIPLVSNRNFAHTKQFTESIVEKICFCFLFSALSLSWNWNQLWFLLTFWVICVVDERRGWLCREASFPGGFTVCVTSSKNQNR